ncbi:MAG: hypothetical protein QM791_23390 [Ferruginibacter sp.]
MFTKFIITVISCFLFVNLYAQQNKQDKRNAVFVPLLQVGLLEGAYGKTAAQLQLVNGFQVQQWFAGIGAGIDYYGDKRSVPVFLGIRRFIPGGSKSFFVYADAGYNISWIRKSQQKYSFADNNFSQQGGLFYDAGVGYRFPLNKIVLGFSGGYSFKKQTEKYILGGCPTCMPSIPPQPDSYEYKFRRISLKMSCWF